MTKIYTIILLISLLTIKVSGQVEVIKFQDLQSKITSADEGLTIFNFWATWCGPCIKEMPFFEEADNRESIKVYFVSVDFKNQLEKVESFVEKRGITSQVLFLDEKDPDDYMPKVSDNWSGAIPATLFVNEMGRSYFHEKSFTKEELNTLIEKYL